MGEKIFYVFYFSSSKSVDVLQKGSLKVCRMKAEAEALGGCRDMKERLTHRNTNQFFE